MIHTPTIQCLWLRRSLDGILDVISTSLPPQWRPSLSWQEKPGNVAGREDIDVRLGQWARSSGPIAVSLALLGVWHLLSFPLSSQGCSSSYSDGAMLDSCSSRCSPSRSRMTCQCSSFQAEPCRAYIPTSLLESHPLMNGSNRAAFRQYVYVHIGYGTYRACPVQAFTFAARRQAYGICMIPFLDDVGTH